MIYGAQHLSASLGMLGGVVVLTVDDNSAQRIPRIAFNRIPAVALKPASAAHPEKTAALVKQGINPIWFDDICLSVTSDESKQINFDRRPKVILSASGM